MSLGGEVRKKPGHFGFPQIPPGRAAGKAAIGVGKSIRPPQERLSKLEWARVGKTIRPAALSPQEGCCANQIEGRAGGRIGDLASTAVMRTPAAPDSDLCRLRPLHDEGGCSLTVVEHLEARIGTRREDRNVAEEVA